MKSRIRPLLRIAFVGIAIVWVIAQAGSYARSREIQRRVRDISGNALASIRLVERMGMDIERVRLLLDERIIETRPDAIARIERDIAAARADYAADARAYDPLSTYPREAEARQRLERDVAAVSGRVTQALELARTNQDEIARARILELEPSFAAIGRDVSDLVDINRTQAEREEAYIAALQRGSIEFQLVLTLVAVLATLALGLWVTRIVAKNERQLHEDAEALEHKNRELDAFAGRVAHDLRGPLSTVNMAASTVAKEAPGAEASVAILRRGIGRMDALIGDLLKLSRVGAASPDAVAEPQAVAKAVADDLRGRVDEVGGTLHVDVRRARVRCDEGFLREVLWNLTENAMKYRRDDVEPAIDLVGREKAGGYELTVSDNGPGMSADDASHVFEPFFRGKSSRSTAGTGLGLSIVKRIVEANGGKVSVRSREGEGTTFVIELPLAAPQRV